MRGEVRSEVLAQMRAEELMGGLDRVARELLGVYERLAVRGAHLLGELLAAGAPAAWERLPAQDAVDRAGRFQWFYHSHGAEDGRGEVEHGHFHLFARRELWEELAQDAEERAFLALAGGAPEADTRHLVAISLDAKGVPIALFAVDSRVSGDAMLSPRATLEALGGISLDTGHPELDRAIASVVSLCMPDIEELLSRRDDALRAARLAQREPPEVLAKTRLDLDARLASALRPGRPARRPASAGRRAA